MLSTRLAHDSDESFIEATAFNADRFLGTLPKPAKPSNAVAFVSVADHGGAWRDWHTGRRANDS
jgi:hypothetical protein